MLCLPAEEPGRSSLSIIMVARKPSLATHTSTNHRILGLFVKSMYPVGGGEGCTLLAVGSCSLFCDLSSWLSLYVICKGQPRARDKEYLEVYKEMRG